MNRPLSSLLVLLLLLPGASLGPTPAPAAERPKDTNAIASLTPEQARKLVQASPGPAIDVLAKTKPAKEYHQLQNPLSLNGLTSLDAATAKELAKHANGSLLLEGLTTLSADAAEALGPYKGLRLGLSGLTTIDAEVAMRLAQIAVSTLNLGGLTTLKADAARSLAGFKGLQLFLDGLTSLDAETAKALGGFKGQHLYLNGLTTLEAQAARLLADFDGLTLDLNGLTAMDVDVAKALAAYKGESLCLVGLTTLDTEALQALADCTGEVCLREEVIHDFITRNPLNHETARVYAAFNGGDLSGLTAVDAATAQTLATIKKWDGNLPGVTALESPDAIAVAEALATRKGPVALPNLKKLSPKTLMALLEKEDLFIPLVDTLELIPEPDGSPTDDFVIPDGLRERQERQLEQLGQ